MTHTVNTTKYHEAHKRNPEGSGLWVFVYISNGKVKAKSSARGEYADCVKSALMFRKQGGYEKVELMP
jgi:hypothetical protein